MFTVLNINIIILLNNRLILGSDVPMEVWPYTNNRVSAQIKVIFNLT